MTLIAMMGFCAPMFLRLRTHKVPGRIESHEATVGNRYCSRRHYEHVRLCGRPENDHGLVLDSACAFIKGLKKAISIDCAVSCAKNGSPLVILQDDGSVFWPIAEVMPADGQNKRPMPFAGKRVTVTGKTYMRGGSTASSTRSRKHVASKRSE